MIFKNTLSHIKVIHVLIAIGLSVFFIPRMFSPGMFFDGLILSDVAINFADHFNGFHKLSATPDYSPNFCDQPPIYFWLYGSYYKLFGHSLLSMYFAKFITLISTLYLLVMLNTDYKKIFATYNYNVSNALVLLMFVASALHGFVFENLMVESLLLPISLLSILQLNKFIVTQNYIYWLTFTLLSFVLFYTKGIQTQFVITYLGCYALFFDTKNILRYVLLGLASLVIVGAIFGFLLYVNEATLLFFKTYWQERIYPSFTEAGEATTQYHFGILYDVLQEYIFTFALLLIAFLTTKVKNINYKFSYFAFLFSCSGILPLMATLEQRRWYFAQAAPFLLLSIAYIIVQLNPPFVAWLNTTLKPKIVVVSCILLLLINSTIITYLHFNYKRDNDTINVLMYAKYKLKQPILRLKENVIEYPNLTTYAGVYGMICYRRDTLLQYTIVNPYDSIQYKTVYRNMQFAIIKNY